MKRHCMHTILFKFYLITSVTDVNKYLSIPYINIMLSWTASWICCLLGLSLLVLFCFVFAAVWKKWRDWGLLNEKLDFSFHLICQCLLL